MASVSSDTLLPGWIATAAGRNTTFSSPFRAPNNAVRPLATTALRRDLDRRLDADLRLHRVGDQAVLLRRLQGAARARFDRRSIFTLRRDFDMRPEAQV